MSIPITLCYVFITFIQWGVGGVACASESYEIEVLQKKALRMTYNVSFLSVTGLCTQLVHLFISSKMFSIRSSFIHQCSLRIVCNDL